MLCKNCFPKYKDLEYCEKCKKLIKSNDRTTFDWEELRKRFYDECTDKYDAVAIKLIKVNLAPHDLFEWFKDYLLHH